MQFFIHTQTHVTVNKLFVQEQWMDVPAFKETA